MKVGDVICVADFHDLCPRLSPRGSFSESRKVGIMEFGLNHTTLIVSLELQTKVYKTLITNKYMPTDVIHCSS